MRIAVCVRQGLDGELNPFDASAYEIALSESGAEVIPVSMGVPKTADLLLHLTRLGVSRAVLLSDPIFAGSEARPHPLRQKNADRGHGTSAADARGDGGL